MEKHASVLKTFPVRALDKETFLSLPGKTGQTLQILPL